jgi:hypothetical protein
MIDRLFYIIYNTYYKHGNFKNDIPPLTVFGLFCMALFSVTLCFVYAFYLIGDPTYFRHNPPIGTGIYFIASIVLTYLLFYRNKRYETIYNRYKHIQTYDQWSVKIMAFAFVFLLIFSTFLGLLIFNKIYFGNWL